MVVCLYGTKISNVGVNAPRHRHLQDCKIINGEYAKICEQKTNEYDD